MNKERAKEKIGHLVEKYEEEKSAGKISQYNEAETKTGFIEPLFQALGWDTQNRDEVGPEATVSGGRADYAFKISGIVKFFVEAKSVRADLDDPEFSQQPLSEKIIRNTIFNSITSGKIKPFEKLEIL